MAIQVKIFPCIQADMQKRRHKKLLWKKVMRIFNLFPQVSPMSNFYVSMEIQYKGLIHAAGLVHCDFMAETLLKLIKCNIKYISVVQDRKFLPIERQKRKIMYRTLRK